MSPFLIVLTVIGAALCSFPDMQGGRHGKRGPPPPPFLRNMTQQARLEYFSILRKTNETIRQQKEEIVEWGQKYGVEAQVREFETNITKHKAELKQNVTELLTKLPSSYQQLSVILDNEDQTPIQMKEALAGFKNQSRTEYNVLTFAAAQFRPRKPRGPRIGGPKGGGRGRFGEKSSDKHNRFE